MLWAVQVQADSHSAPQPEVGYGLSRLKTAEGDKHMVVTANPIATQVGANIIADGGSAADAAVAIQLVLNLVEPQSSGIGGGAFALWSSSADDSLLTYDGRETAPLAATPNLFVDADGEKFGFWRAVIGGRSVGAPGTLKLLEKLHADHGQLPWSDLVAPAITLARDGFEASPRLARSVSDSRGLANFKETREYFFPGGKPIAAGDRMTNEAFASLLESIAANGADAFYAGDLPTQISERVQSTVSNPGLLSADDIKNYEVIMRDPVCMNYRGFRVCGMGPPSSGMTTVGQILGILQHHDMSALGETVAGYHYFLEASRLAYADRGRYLGDSDFVEVPVTGLLDPGYLKERADLIQADKSMGTAESGTPPGVDVAYALGSERDLAGTTHISIVDAAGNALSMTSTIENGFGSRVMVSGFLLNNELTDFSFVPERDGLAVANRVEPNKRPRSSMAPTLVYDPDGNLKYVIGSPGGSRIIAYVALALVRLIDWDSSLSSAISKGHLLSRNGNVDIERDSSVASAELIDALESLGHETKVRDLNSGLSAIEIGKNGYMTGVADPRREGTVVSN